MTTRTFNFVCVILDVAYVGLLITDTARFASVSTSLVALFATTQSSNHVKILFISQLITGSSSVLQILLKYFNGTAISTSFSVSLPSNPPGMLVL